MARDYRKGMAKYRLVLSDAEFIWRFCLHVLPKGFVRIRHYGILSSSKKKIILPIVRVQVGIATTKREPGPILHGRCPVCKKGQLVTLLVFDNRGRQNIGSRNLKINIKDPKTKQLYSFNGQPLPKLKVFDRIGALSLIHI